MDEKAQRNDPSRALRSAARQRSRRWAWSSCQVYTTVTSAETGLGENYQVTVDVNGVDGALSMEEASGRQYSAYWLVGDIPKYLGDWDNPVEALDHAERVIAEIAAGVRKPEEVGR